MIAYASTSAIPNPVNGLPGVFNALCQFTAYFIWMIITLCVIMVAIAAFNFMTSGGEPEKVSKARRYLIYSAVGVAVALCASVFPVLVGSTMGYQSPTGQGLTPMCAIFGGTG
jgi:Type IV secretion system pilin